MLVYANCYLARKIGASGAGVGDAGRSLAFGQELA
jgi:hypothetical protein